MQFPEQNTELMDMTRRFWLGLLLGIPVLVLAMSEMVTGIALLSSQVNYFVQAILTTIIVRYCGEPFFVRAWTSIVNRSPNMFTLIAMGVGAAYLYSLVAVLFPGVFPEGFSHHGAVEPYFESAATIIVLVLLGQMLELKARHATSSAIRRLMGLAPKTARVVLPDGKENDLPIELLQPGDVVRVR